MKVLTDQQREAIEDALIRPLEGGVPIAAVRSECEYVLDTYEEDE